MLKYIIIAAITVIVIIPVLILVLRLKNFRPNPDKAAQLERLNRDLAAAGFTYSRHGGFFYSRRDCWQRGMGYCKLYDETAPFFNMIMDCEPVRFSYGGKRWLIELWKGQYGIATGAEIGVYNTDRPDISSERFTGTFYDAAKDSEQLDISFTLYKDNKKLLSRRARHWWLTAFLPGEFSDKKELSMHIKIKFPDREMLGAFVRGLRAIGYECHELMVRRMCVSFIYNFPHTPQPASQDGIQKAMVQRMNKTNCGIYNATTAKYAYTPDKLESLRSFAPEIYDFMLRSIYAREFFKSFEWLPALIRGKGAETGNMAKCPSGEV